MAQVGSKLRRGESRYFHFCPACKQLHELPDTWAFNGDLEKPTFSPSFLHKGNRLVLDDAGNWTGDWLRDSAGNLVPYVCHYILTDGILNFCGDCSHEMAGQSVPLPVLPERLRDD